MRNGWPPEMTDRLRQQHGAGLSASQSARVLNAEFGSVLTRNAVIGKTHRLGLKRETPRSPRMAAKREPKIRFARVLRVKEDLRLKRIAPPEPASMTDVTCAKPWLERTFGECAYPVSGVGADTWSCCAPTSERYCRAHARLMFNPKVQTHKSFVRGLRRAVA